jgi:hypothetical protein
VNALDCMAFILSRFTLVAAISLGSRQIYSSVYPNSVISRHSTDCFVNVLSSYPNSALHLITFGSGTSVIDP